jgi:hypothetical protein
VSGDSTGANGVGDLVSAALTVDGGNLTVEVHYLASSFNPNTSLATVSLDLDQNAATGHQGIDSNCTVDTGNIGSEYILTIGSAGSTPAKVYQYQGSCNAFLQVGTATITPLTDGYRVVVPLSLLGNDDGRLNFKVASAEQVSPAPGYTGFLDVMPDVGTAAGSVPTPPPPIGLLNVPGVIGMPKPNVFQTASWIGIIQPARGSLAPVGDWNRVFVANRPERAVTQAQRQQN